MAYYLIDFENVKSRGMEGVELLAEEDTVCIFYSDNADSMTFDLHRKLNETKAQIIYHKVAVGTKNALDFQLATYLGYLICEQQREGIHPDYFIVTKDNGFTSLMVYWKAQGVPVRITRNLLWGKNPTAEQNPAAEENAMEVTESTEQESVQALSVEAAEPMAVEITEQETENATAVMTEEPKAEVDAEEIAEPAFVSVQILEEPLPEILEPVPVEPVKKTVRKKSGNTRKKNTANMTEKKTTEKTVDKKASEKKAAEEPDELAQAVEKVLSDQTIVPQETLDLPHDHRHGIGREPHLKGTVKFIDCFHKPDGSDLEQILVLCTSAGEAADNAPHQSHILLNKLCSRSLISMVCSVDQAHHIIHRDYLLFCISKSFPHGHCSSQPRL